MTSARRTPRYVGVIGSEPIGPQLMGPHPMPGPASAPQPALVPSASHGRRSGSGILPLYPDQPVRYSPDSDSRPVVLAPASRPAPIGRVVPVERRPWRVMIVSAAPAAAPRSFEVSRWQARAAIAALVLAATLAVGFVATVVVAVRAPEAFGDPVEAQELRAELAAVRDSLALSRTALAESESADSGDEESETGPETMPDPIPEAAAIPVPEPPASRPKPFGAHTHAARMDVHGDGVLALMPRSLAELPVIGALASGFSRARWHPLLHRVRPHLGVDLAAPRGTRVSAPAPGRVTFVGRKLGFGLVVELDHGDGITTRYAHLRSSAVERGEHVTKGEAIAAVGTSGITTGPHLHYEVLVHGRQVDPLRFRFAQGDVPASVAAEPASAAAVVPAPGVGGAVAPSTAAPSAPAVRDGPSATLPGPPR